MAKRKGYEGKVYRDEQRANDKNFIVNTENFD